MSENISEKQGLALLAAHNILKNMGQAGEYVWRLSKEIPMSERLPYLRDAVAHLKMRVKQGATRWSELPVDIITFIESPLLLNMPGQVYPAIKEELKHICSGQYNETIFTGGIGSGKTSTALVVIAYGLYELSCMANAQKTFGLTNSSEISFIFQSINAGRAKEVSFDRFVAIMKDSPYFSRIFPFNKDKTSVLEFPRNIRVKPVSGDPKAAIGENVIGGIIDEINFMQVVEKSAMSADGGTFDQAKEMYDSIARRRESRFMLGGVLYGMLCCVSSKRYPGEFTDQKIEEAKTNPRIRIYDKRIWEVKPDSASGNWFYLHKGDITKLPRVLPAEEVREYLETEPEKLMMIPEEYRSAFDGDLLGAVRDIAGVSTLAMHPYMVHADKVADCFDKAPSILSSIKANLITEKVKFLKANMKNAHQPRFAHIDLGLTGDSAGIAIGHVPKFVQVKRFDSVETMPQIHMDCVLEVPPPKNGEIEFDAIRRLLYNLREAGLPLKWVSFDSFQSRDSIQILAQKGFTAGLSSMDTSNLPYDVLKQALYDGRVIMHKHDHVQTELVRLEQDPKTGKIDHPADFSKDCADAMAGVAYGLTMRRKVWSMHGVSTREIPDHLVRSQKDEPAGKEPQGA